MKDVSTSAWVHRSSPTRADAPPSREVHWHEGQVARTERERAQGHRGATVWLTGLSGSGKSTLARTLEVELFRRGVRTYVLDGDNIRHGLNRDLGFGPAERTENIRRIGEVAKLFADAGVLVVTAFISPYREDRERVRALHAPDEFVEVLVDAPLAVCEARDPKGMYARARRGELPEFTGVSAPYEPPDEPELVVDTSGDTVAGGVRQLLEYLERRGLLGAAGVSGDPSATAALSAQVYTDKASATQTPERDAIAPYGGVLVDRRLAGAAAEAARHRATSLPQVRLTPVGLSDLFLIAVGALSPLEGFLGSADYEAVLERMTLANGLPWSIPITLPMPAADADHLSHGDEVALIAPDGEVAGVLRVGEVYDWDVAREAERVYGTTEGAHPGVARLLAQAGTRLVAGPIEYLYPREVSGFPRDHLTPAETRAEIRRRGWRTVVGFQTRNPVHRAHEYLQKVALELVDGLLLHPLVGDTKADDVPASVRLECYRRLLDGYYPAERVLFSVLPAAMRYAGPREALFHAILRRNYGCSHFIVGRDHAGVGNYYHPLAAQQLFDTVDLGRLGIQALRFENSFYCRRCGQMASEKTCPHGPDERVTLSGTRVRQLLAQGERPPVEFSRAEVADVLIRAYAGHDASADGAPASAGNGHVPATPASAASAGGAR